MAMLTCPYCKGTGNDPFFGTRSRPSKCAVCKGKQENFVPEPHTGCPACRGTGRDPHYRTPCAFCMGRGYVSKDKAERYKK